MNTQTIVLNRNNVVLGTNNTKYIYQFPKKIKIDGQEIALASLNMYYSWPNIQAMYNNNVFTYVWWDYQGNLTNTQNIIIPDGNYSISVLSSFIQSQMLLRGHYLKQATSQNKIYFISFIENPTYYATEITINSMFAYGSQTDYINENIPVSHTDPITGQTYWTGWKMPSTRQYPQVVFTQSSKMREFLGFNAGTYPIAGTPVNSMYDILGQIAPMTYPVSAINIQSNFCYSDIAIPNNILFSFSQGNSTYGDLIIKDPQNLIWCRIPDGIYNQLELLFIDQDFNPLKILDNQLNITILIRDIN